MAYDSPQAWLDGGGGAPGFFKKGDQFGKAITGKILKTEIRQERDFTDQKPKFYEDGNPIEQMIVTLQTTLRDPADPKDDGKRRVFLKNRTKPALREAVQAGGSNTLEIGGVLTVTYEGDDPPSKPGLNPSRRYGFKYISLANAALMAGNTPQAAATPPVEAPKPAVTTNVDTAKAVLAGLSAEELTLLGLPTNG